MKKVLIITYYWPPSGGAGVQRWLKFTKYLYQLGVKPFVLTVDPAYATYPQTDESLLEEVSPFVNVNRTESFELYSLYKKVSSNKEVPYGGFANTPTLNSREKLLRFIRGNFFIPDPRKGWNRFAVKKAKEIVEQHNIKTIITTSPPHSTHLIGLKLKKTLNVNWIADFRDPWTEIFYFKQLYPTQLVKQLHLRMEKNILVHSDYVITVSDDLKRILSAKINTDKKKICVIENGYDPDDFPASTKQMATSQDYLYISYVGTISDNYNISGFINAINLLPQEMKSKIKIRFIGKISENIVAQFIQSGLKELIETVGYVKHSEAINYLLTSRVLLLIIPGTTNNKGVLTGKLFEYLASRKPVLCLGPTDGDAARIIHETQSGVTCDYNDHNKIKNNLIQILKKNDQSAEEDKTSMYSRENLTKKLVKLLES